MRSDVMLRRLMASEWTAAALCLLAVLIHVLWFRASQHQAEVLSGFGGCLTALGILVAAQPYIRKGVRRTAREQVGLEEAHVMQEHPDKEEKAESEAMRHVLKERVVGVLLIGTGSLLNGYGPAIAGALGLRGN